MYNTINATAVLSDPLTPINDAQLKIFFIFSILETVITCMTHIMTKQKI